MDEQDFSVVICKVTVQEAFQRTPFFDSLFSSCLSHLLLSVLVWAEPQHGCQWKPGSTVVLLIQRWVADALAGWFWFSLCCFSQRPSNFSDENDSFHFVLHPVSPRSPADCSSFLLALSPQSHAMTLIALKTWLSFTEEAIQKQHRYYLCAVFKQWVKINAAHWLVFTLPSIRCENNWHQFSCQCLPGCPGHGWFNGAAGWEA